MKTHVFVLMMFLIMLLTACAKRKDNIIAVTTKNIAISQEYAHVAMSKYIGRNSIKPSSSILDSNATEEIVSNQQLRFDESLTLANRLQQNTLSAEKLTDEQIAQIIALVRNPWELDSILWQKYITTCDSNNLAIAESIFRYIIAHYADSKSQAYARNHLGRVNYQKRDLQNALDMYISVERQPDGIDFWYVDAMDEAGSIAYKLMETYSDDAVFEHYYSVAVNSYDKALEACDVPSVKALLYFYRAHVLINKDTDDAGQSFKSAAVIYKQTGNTEMYNRCLEMIACCH
ncbi:MAG: hypothetical protein NTV22_13075 [bacterium]|nr:hypothetical protein [bacterium]